MSMSLFRPTFESSPSDTPAEAGVQRTSANFHEAIMDSISSVRDSLPKQHRAHFETLRQEIIIFTEVHGIPKESLGKPDLLREVTGKLSTSDLERLANLLERFEYLLKNGEPKKEEIDLVKAIEYAKEHYHLREQYDSQVELLEEVGILKEGVILGIDGNTYPIPTLEQIAVRLFERRETLETKHNQGFTKLLLVPFGMSLDSLQETLEQFLLEYKKNNPSFNLNMDDPLCTWSVYQRADIGDSPKLVYEPQSFTEEGHGGKTKAQILEEQSEGRWTPAFAGVKGEKGLGTPGWTVHLLQPSNPNEQDIETPKGFAPIPREGRGTPQENLVPRHPLEAGKSPNEYLSILQNAQGDKDWITAFMIHISETGQPLDDVWNPTNKECISYLTGAFFRSSIAVPCMYWCRGNRQADLDRDDPRIRDGNIGLRSSVIV
ncbi:MAG: hypothetical protein UX45_C0020G0002 [Candidatus Uhrbacteria bacterium GW2011_GWF2_46_218]|uniref:Uncharacterized protein n=1 Tax=Candidatus Uhrbacteria bacterium GW2011_GWF2_46_218 TaxID=1619001 RepID=A0A0G1PHM0_9BACT|nr:MAG: hypothetical protein UX45_C0020G0002 [Candidatus Uhrbacteria bacterium GW2011_GWF2_46_218]